MKGQSGNPGGRPKAIVQIEQIARENSPIAMKTLVEIANDKKAPSAARVSAATAILDRGYGKPRQDTRVQHVDEFEKLSDEELRTLVIERAAEILNVTAERPH
jgi:hypothetical protein